MVLEALYGKIRPGCSRKLLMLMTWHLLISKIPEGLKGRLEALKGSLESKGLRVNVTKTKTMISGENVI